MLRVLALNPYHGGSHEQFLSQWQRVSQHRFWLETLPPRHFKWRMRQAAVHFADKLRATTDRFDVLFCTSMLNSAELRGLLPRRFAGLPLVTYFHENQGTYPVQGKDARDVNFPLINWTSALAADQAWFNSRYNLDSFLEQTDEVLKLMPDHRMRNTVDEIARKCVVAHPGIEPAEQLGTKHRCSSLQIVWVGRWEHDKNPDGFVEALRGLAQRGIDFRLTVLGESFRQQPTAFSSLHSEFSGQLLHSGFEPNRSRYFARLAASDVVVSCAHHEFFGLAILEAVSAGCIPLVPDRLVYPELYPKQCRYSGTRDMVELLVRLARIKSERGTLDEAYAELGLHDLVTRFSWTQRRPALDERLTNLHGSGI